MTLETLIGLLVALFGTGGFSLIAKSLLERDRTAADASRSRADAEQAWEKVRADQLHNCAEQLAAATVRITQLEHEMSDMHAIIEALRGQLRDLQRQGGSE